MRRRRVRVPPPGWLLARGIHRPLVGFLLVAVALGAGGGWLLREDGRGLVCLGVALILAVWPLAWVAAWRIAWPLRNLAGVAAEIRAGRLQSRDALPEAGGEVGEVACALRGVSDRVAKQLRDQRALLAAVSHELRSPLGRARVLVELAREGSGSPTVHDELQAEIDDMDRLVDDLLAASRIDFEAVAPVEAGAGDLARRAAEVAGLDEAAVTVGGDAPVRVDPTLWTRALAGLVDNARRYGETNVRLGVRARAGRVRFEVVDDGPGFPVDPEQAFQPFWRGPDTAPRSGTGLGLALVRQVAEAHGGEAGAENRPEGGARVWMEVECADGTYGGESQGSTTPR